MHLYIFFLYIVNCGGELTAATGKITSPEYPMAYPYYQNCTWNIACTGSVEITINNFEVGPTAAGLNPARVSSKFELQIGHPVESFYEIIFF
jgi:hypothetical protein